MELLIRNNHTRESDLCETGAVQPEIGDLVVYESRYGLDIGTVVGPISEELRKRFKDARNVVRITDEKDRAEYRKNEKLAREAARVCTERV